MKIVIFSIVPLFPNHDMGGAQKHLRYIAKYLGERGHQVDILCTRRFDNPEAFQWHPNVYIHPILQFKQPFPSPYDTGAAHIANIIQDLVNYLDKADRFYMHDGEFLLPFVYQHIPTVISLRDNVYPETILGAFLGQAHKTIVISDYSRDFVMATVGRFFPKLPERLERINNGLDWGHFRPTAPKRILQHIPNLPTDKALILHPHRPEDSKGMNQTIALAEYLKYTKKRNDFVVLVPRWLGLAEDEGVRHFYERVDALLAEKGLTEQFLYHNWIPYDLLPEYYSLGALSLSLGNFVESFGNAVYESLGCGTPTIVARIATHRSLLPDSLIDKVDFNDIASAGELADEILTTKRRTSPETLDYLQTHYDFKQQLAQYAQVIENAQVVPPLEFQPQILTNQTRYRLAPWTYYNGNAIYHDFHADYLREQPLISLMQHHKEFSPAQAADFGLSAADVEKLYRDSYIVPIINSSLSSS